MSATRVKVATWNLNNCCDAGGTLFDLRESGADPSLFVDLDFLALQEVPFRNGAPTSDVTEVLERAGFPTFEHLVLAAAYNRDDGADTALLLASRVPPATAFVRKFDNPELEAVVDDSTWKSDDKGLITVHADTGGLRVSVTDTHLLPFTQFGLTLGAPAAREPWTALVEHAELETEAVDLIVVTGDFNRSEKSLGTLKSAAYGRTTRDSGDSVDDIFVSPWAEVRGVVIQATRSDHHLVIGELECSRRPPRV
jgi:endonuclease/exonuclease/phosphatase family metal-dependent hydrolase